MNESIDDIKNDLKIIPSNVYERYYMVKCQYIYHVNKTMNFLIPINDYFINYPVLFHKYNMYYDTVYEILIKPIPINNLIYANEEYFYKYLNYLILFEKQRVKSSFIVEFTHIASSYIPRLQIFYTSIKWLVKIANNNNLPEDIVIFISKYI